jgi:hypothetical protein
MASCSLPVATMASTSKKRSAVLCDEELECLLQSDSDQSLSDSNFDTENELDDRAVLDAMRNEHSDVDDSGTQAFIWENMQNYNGQRENFTGSVEPQGPVKGVMEIVDIFELVFSEELIDTIVRETKRRNSYVGVNYQSGRLLGHGNL